MMLLDKGYFDYDFERVEAPDEIVNWEDTVLDEEETASVVAMFGIGRRKPETIEDIQNYLIKEESYGS